MKSFIFIIGFLVISGCSSSQNKTTKEVSFRLNYGFYDKGDIKLKDHTEQHLAFAFPIISGQLFGRPSKDMLAFSIVTNPNDFLLKLPLDMKGHSAILQNSSLNIIPVSTKISRLGTFHYLPHYKNGLGGGGFKIKDSGNAVILVHFSQASKITGDLVIKNNTYVHDIEIDSTGWHWLEILKTSSNNYTLKSYNGNINDIELIAFLMN